jgi:hypothetical protein
MRDRVPGVRKFTDASGVECEFYSSGASQMPDELLKLVHQKNATKLNRASNERWQKIHQNI